MLFSGLTLATRSWLRQAQNVPVPEQAPAGEGFAPVPGARLWYWDTGGDGEPVVLLHPGTGSALIWGYQQPVFAAAGYRVIAYSRRGHYNSDAASAEDPGTAAGDLHHLVEHLVVEKFHLVGSAAGGIVALDYALSYANRLLSLTLACTLAGVVEEDFQTMLGNVMPERYRGLPPELLELGPSYRAVNPEGVAEWLALEHRAVTGRRAQNRLNEIRWENVEKLDVPTLLIVGEADLYSPPPVMRALAHRLPRTEVVTLPEIGHSAYWEAPAAFNDAVLRFLANHAAR
jgi:pimeloyl-ACP methyl ester carboxylesterase